VVDVKSKDIANTLAGFSPTFLKPWYKPLALTESVWFRAFILNSLWCKLFQHELSIPIFSIPNYTTQDLTAFYENGWFNFDIRHL